MILFTSNHCPTSHGIEDRLRQLVADMQGRSFALVAINPNNPEGMTPEELGFGKYTDSFEDMVPYAREQGWQFPYLYDGETQAAARAYGCLATPHVFLFDRARTLRYAGRFDDSRFPDPATVKSPDARRAIEALLAGQPVPTPLTKPHGCSTKWREKRTLVAAAEARWEQLPVAFERIDAVGVAALRRNGTPKLRLINVWATWCAPCVEEFPELVHLQRVLALREFELVTISVDDPADEERARAFLERQRAATPPDVQKTVEAEGRRANHYLFTGASTDELMAALDPDWPGPVPHTVLVAPDGRIVYRHTGKIDRAEVREKVIEILTPCYQ
jgi:thiol-disulfide isomerase/thioredoxin